MGRWLRVAPFRSLCTTSLLKGVRLASRKTAYFLVWLSDQVDDAFLVPKLNRVAQEASWDEDAIFRRLCKGRTARQWFEAYRKAKAPSTTAALPALPSHLASDPSRPGYQVAYRHTH